MTLSSFEEAKRISEEVKNLPFLERIQYYNEAGFKSFDLVAEYHYRQAAKSRSREEIIEYVTNHSEFLVINVDQDGEESLEFVFEDNPFRYIAGEDQIISVDNRVYRLLDNGLISTPAEQRDALTKLDVNSIPKSSEKIYSFSSFEVIQFRPELTASYSFDEDGKIDDQVFDNANICLGNVDRHEWSGTRTNGKNRHNTKFELWDDWSGAGVELMWKLKFKAQKKSFGVWINAWRTMQVEMAFRLDCYLQSSSPSYTTGWFVPAVEDEGEPGYVGVVDLVWSGYEAVETFEDRAYIDVINSAYTITGYHIGALDIYTDTPSASAYSFECNRGLLPFNYN